jgi:hypothetical protein
MKLLKILTEESESTTQSIATKYRNEDVMYHCSDDFRYSFNLEYIKGGSRGIHGWGIYFASTPFKASDYGDYMTIVDKSNLNLLSLRTKISDEFIKKLEINLNDDDGFNDVIKILNTDIKYENLKDYDIQSFSDLIKYKSKFENALRSTRNNRDYDEINNIISNIEKLLLMRKEDKSSSFQSVLYNIKENINKTIDDLIIYVFNNYPSSYEKTVSLFFKKCGYDGFDYDDYEFIIFNTDNLKVVENIKIR